MQNRRNVYSKVKKTSEGFPMFDFHKYQRAIWNSEKRFLGLIAGTGGGKTFLGPPWLMAEVLDDSESKSADYFIAAPVYKMLNRKSLPTMLEYLDMLCEPSALEYTHKKNDAEIILNTGAHIFLCSTDKPESLEGMQCKAGWADEAGQMSKYAWEVMQRRIGFEEGRLLMTTTPYAQNWLYHDFLLPFKNEEEENYYAVQFESRESPYFPQAEYERAKRNLDPDTFDMFYRAKFRKKAGLIYNNFAESMVIEPFEIPEGWKLYAGLDWGYNDPTVFSQWAMNKNGTIFNIGEHYAKEALIEKHAKKIAKMMDGRYHEIYYDPRGKQETEELKNMLYKKGCTNFTVKVADNAVVPGIRAVKSLIHQDKVRIFNTCEHIIDEISMYSWDTNSKGDYVDKPVKRNDHALDGLRYWVYTGLEKRLEPILVTGSLKRVIA